MAEGSSAINTFSFYMLQQASNQKK